MQRWLEKLEVLVWDVLPYQVGSAVFWGVLVVDLFALLVFGWLVHGSLFNGKKPAWLVWVVNVLALGLGLAVSAAVLAFVPLQDFQPPILGWLVVGAAGAGVYLLAVAFIARPLLEHNFGPALGVLLVSLLCTLVAAWMVNVLIRSVGGSLSDLGQRQERRLPK